MNTALLDFADLAGDVWNDTICPDGSNSIDGGGACVNDL